MSELISLIEKGKLGEFKKDGVEYKIHCPNPEHRDTNASCYINVRKEVFCCHGCTERGGVWKLLKWLELGPIKSEATYSYKKSTHAPVQFLDDGVLDTWKYSPDEWIELGFSVNTLFEHGIGYDLHNKRITVPIRDKYGRLIAVSGALTIKGQKPRYLAYKQELGAFKPDDYSPRTKSVLWRQDRLDNDTRELIVVEGFKACLWLVQSGFPNTVATMGTAVTEGQVSLIASTGLPVIVMFDGDRAGVKAAPELGIRLYRKGISVSYATPKDGLQPDELNKDELSELLRDRAPHVQRRPDVRLVTERTLLPKTEIRSIGRKRGRGRISVQR
jgi:DNA primase